MLAHLVRRAEGGSGPLVGDVATVLRVEDGAITEIVTLTDRGLEEFWAGA